MKGLILPKRRQQRLRITSDSRLLVNPWSSSTGQNEEINLNDPISAATGVAVKKVEEQLITATTACESDVRRGAVTIRKSSPTRRQAL